MLLVAPNERKVRIEVGYGLEGVLTDAAASTVVQSLVLPRFRAGDLQGGVEAGARGLLELLRPEGDAAPSDWTEQPRLQEPQGIPWPTLSCSVSLPSCCSCACCRAVGCPAAPIAAATVEAALAIRL